jgi:cytochrome c oxidase subunit 2
MIAQLQFMPEQASDGAAKVDALYYSLLGVSGFFTILIATLVITFAVRYRRKGDEIPPRVNAWLGLEIVWSVLPLLIGLVIFCFGASTYFEMSRPPDDALEIHVVGKQWMWKLQHPDGQREINALHVPAGQAVRLTMISEDVIHSFYVPAFRVKQDVLPGRYSTMWFRPTKPGRYNLFCAEYCGTEHAQMEGWVEVMEPADYEVWLTQHAEGSPALEGGKLFRKLKCISCHHVESGLAPLLENVYGNTVPLDGGSTVVADREYLRESILNPKAKVVAGFKPIMPSFRDQVTEEEILQLIAFIRSLKTGQTPNRVEETRPPIADPKSPKEQP